MYFFIAKVKKIATEKRRYEGKKHHLKMEDDSGMSKSKYTYMRFAHVFCALLGRAHNRNHLSAYK